MLLFSTDRVGAVVIVTIDHQERGNALSGDAAAALADVVDEASMGDGDVRAVLIRSAGKHFCTGADVSSRNDDGGEKPISAHMVRSLGRTHHRCVAAVFHCRVPVVAAVQGAAQGFGLHLALAADFVVAGESASFKDPFTDRGFNVDSGGSWLIPRLVGLTRAKARLASNSTAPGRSRELMIDPISVPSTSNAQITIAARCCRCRRSRWYRCACG